MGKHREPVCALLSTISGIDSEMSATVSYPVIKLCGDYNLLSGVSPTYQDMLNVTSRGTIMIHHVCRLCTNLVRADGKEQRSLLDHLLVQHDAGGDGEASECLHHLQDAALGQFIIASLMNGRRITIR